MGLSNINTGSLKISYHDINKHCTFYRDLMSLKVLAATIKHNRRLTKNNTKCAHKLPLVVINTFLKDAKCYIFCCNLYSFSHHATVYAVIMWPPVTSRSSTKTAKPRITSSLMPNISAKFQWHHPKRKWEIQVEKVKISHFRPISCQSHCKCGSISEMVRWRRCNAYRTEEVQWDRMTFIVMHLLEAFSHSCAAQDKILRCHAPFVGDRSVILLLEFI